MEIAIASTGLGHVTRGIETWALALAKGLTNVDDLDVTLFCGAALKNQDNINTIVVPCLKRGDWVARLMARIMPSFAWRWGLRSCYSIEQRSFARNLIPLIAKGKYDIVHTQDVILADMLERARRTGRIKTSVIFAHGTDEDIEYLKQFEYIQHLSPEDEENVRAITDNIQQNLSLHNQYMIPNFVDTKTFHPRNEFDAKSANLRNKLSIPQDAFVVGCAAAIKKTHKRINYLIREFSEFSRKYLASHPNCNTPPYLIVAGARADESDDIVTMAEDLGNGFVRILFDLPLDDMPDFYRMLDIFVLPSLREVFGIVLLEAMASGVPVVAHNSSTMRWIVGSNIACTHQYDGLSHASDVASFVVDMSQDHALSDFLLELDMSDIQTRKQRIREHVEKYFSWNAVCDQFVAMYSDVVKSSLFSKD